MKRQNGEGVVSKIKHRISTEVLKNTDELVEKVDAHRYDSALCDTLKALIAVYNDPDPIGKVQRGEFGQVNIEVRSNNSRGEEAVIKKDQHEKPTSQVGLQHGIDKSTEKLGG